MSWRGKGGGSGNGRQGGGGRGHNRGRGHGNIKIVDAAVVMEAEVAAAEVGAITQATTPMKNGPLYPESKEIAF
jgi:hypothetical protein